MADILMNKYDCQYLDLENQDDVIEELMTFQRKFYEKKKKSEQCYWVDKPPRFLE
jgi:hypothetical protein